MNAFLGSVALLFGLFSASPALGAEAPRLERLEWNHTFFGTYGGGYSMVACSYAEARVEEWMTRLGASHLEIRCQGGVESSGLSPIIVNVRYDAPDLSGELRTEKATIESDGWDSNCVVDTDFLRALLPTFPNTKVLRKNSMCMGPQSRYAYDLAITLPKK
jgi:hypothetical protein